MERAFQHWFLKHTDEQLINLVHATKLTLDKTYHDNQIPRLDRITDELHEIRPDYRVTLIKTDGTVVGDSTLTPSEILHAENHAKRSEIIQASKEGIGRSTRHSKIMDEDLIYYAEVFKDDNFEGFIRVSTSTEHMTSALWGLRTLLTFIFLGVLSILLVLMVMSHKMLNHHISEEREGLEDRVAERTKEIELLHRLANMLAACNTMSEAQQVVGDIVPRLLGDINGAISLMRSSRNQLEIKLDWGGNWPGEKSYAPDECWALRKGKFHLANDEHTTLPCKHMHTVNGDQTLCIPLIAHGNTIGILHLYLKDENLNEEKQQVAFTIGEHLGLALANLNLQDKLREQAIRDPLTGLYNRRFLEESLDHEIMRAQRREQCLSVLMLDVDHFKRFNDTFGHDAGDYVLKSLGSLLTENLRGEDIVCRIGGEELAIVLPETGLENSDIVAAKVCDLIREQHLNFHGQSLGQLTISIGIATYPHQGDKAEVLLKSADIALYEAKESGRDRFCHSSANYEPLMANAKSLVQKIMKESPEPDSQTSGFLQKDAHSTQGATFENSRAESNTSKYG
ncbi:diguanylate cyclase [Litoribacillus peritrichatus]|uniref:diguanylate cyclase n=1 Tax=Litoribacillus peritrichatus TaxID=718191 RepID=A0ABP7MDX2_9GAMM